MRKVVPLLIALTASAALAHAELTQSSPAESAAVAAPKQVQMTFSEGVQLKFSTFKVYALPAGGDALAVNRAADALMAQVLRTKNDAAKRADAGLKVSTGTTPKVTVLLKPNLKPGRYVVMWSALSDDTHPVTGRYLFSVK